MKSAPEAGSEAETHGRAEPPLDVRVDRTHDTVELGDVDGRERELAAEVDGVLGPDAEAHGIEALVAAQQELVERGGLLLGCGHEVRLVPERVVADRQPDGDEVALLTPQADVPPVDLGVAVDRSQHGVVVTLSLEPLLDDRDCSRAVVVTHTTQLHSTSVRAVRSA